MEGWIYDVFGVRLAYICISQSISHCLWGIQSCVLQDKQSSATGEINIASQQARRWGRNNQLEQAATDNPLCGICFGRVSSL